MQKEVIKTNSRSDKCEIVKKRKMFKMADKV